MVCPSMGPSFRRHPSIWDRSFCSIGGPLHRIQHLLATTRAYAVLDCRAAQGGTWTAGGCALLALALARLISQSQIFDLLEGSGHIQHLVLRLGDGYFLDGDGIRPPLKLRPNDSVRLSGSEIPCHAEDVQEVYYFLTKVLSEKGLILNTHSG